MRGDRDDREVPGGSGRSIRRLARPVALIGSACVLILAFMVLFTEPVEPGPPPAFGTSEWTLVSNPSQCRATDQRGYAYSAQLTNHSDSARDFTLRVAFDVDGRRQAIGTAHIEGVAVGSAAPVEVSVPASFPESLPKVRCRAEIRHAPAS